MLKYAEKTNEELKTCNVGIGTDEEFYKLIGFQLLDVEEGYDGLWYLKGYAPKKTLEMFKNEKLLELSEKSSKFEDNLNKDMYFISSLGFKSDGDRRTNMNIQSLIDTYQISQAQGLPVLYWDYDNVEHETSLQDLQTLKMEQIINGNNLYTQKKKFKDLIENAKSIEELNKIDLTFQMMDFRS